jgi:4'-phosphopantetheinyl transferase
MEFSETAGRFLPQLSHSDVHLWIASLDRPTDELACVRTALTQDEIKRASAFKFELDRSRFIAARGILRQLLGHYTECEPRSIRMEYNHWGKPSLAGRSARNDIRFNLSHSHGLAVYAIAHEREVGVDVEMIQPEFVNERVAEHFFSRAEVESLRVLPFEHQVEAFFACWTRKEAYIKAIGRGLTIELASFDVSLRPGERPALLRSVNADRWSLEAFQPARGYVAALAIEGAGYRLGEPRWFRGTYGHTSLCRSRPSVTPTPGLSALLSDSHPPGRKSPLGKQRRAGFEVLACGSNAFEAPDRITPSRVR